MPIRVLPTSVSAGLAAGEVIERPASVVKELVENSIDAGARKVTVEIRQGGLQSIRVVDDGCGIADDDVELAFERHATSKLTSLDELSRLGTLGFRGEALASIAAASHVRLVTRTTEASSASVVDVEGGASLRRGKVAAAQGTTVEVEALFSTIPARLKFIRSAPAETARIRAVLDHMAMANPGVRFSLSTEQRTLFQTTGSGELRDVMGAVYGVDIASQMVEVVSSTRAPYAVSGLVSTPQFNRSNRTAISIFVNGRWVMSPTLATAVQEAFRGLLMEGRFPYAVVFVEIPPDLVDVNVHPNKREVRFVHDGDAFSSVERSVREALVEADPTVAAQGLFVVPSPATTTINPPPSFDFTRTSSAESWHPLPEPSDRAITDAIDRGGQPSPSNQAAGEVQGPSRMPLRVLGQISNAYIVAEGPDGMHLIDQHAAHESVLYYRLLKQWESREADVQPMLDPLPVELNAEQLDVVGEAAAAMTRFGLTLEEFGGGAYLVRSVPAMARKVDASRLVAEVLDLVRTSVPGAPGLQHEIAASIACHSAVRAGQALDQQEMQVLADALVKESNPQHCPHGRPTTVKVTTHMLERQFGRA